MVGFLFTLRLFYVMRNFKINFLLNLIIKFLAKFYTLSFIL